MSTTYKKPSVTVDCVVFGLDEEDLKIILIERDLEPFKGKWALPGGFVNIDETLEAAAMRELQEETGVKNVFLEQLYTFGDVDRDPGTSYLRCLLCPRQPERPQDQGSHRCAECGMVFR
jgi:8-oxo-dGTP diphosphatase